MSLEINIGVKALSLKSDSLNNSMKDPYNTALQTELDYIH